MLMEFKHTPIMINECLNGLNINENGIYVDGTVGGGGHSIEILKRLKNGKLIAIDKDVEALNNCQKRFEKYLNKVIFVHDDFKNINNILKNISIDKIDGILLDLGVSSYQIDNADRGFSYRFDSLLDMRMNQEQNLTAEKVVNEYEEEKLLKIFYEYGEEQFSKNIVKNIIKNRPIKTTGQLAQIIKNSVPVKYAIQSGNPCKKVFQALRIEVNGELNELENAINSMVEHLNSKGRIAIITFHSLEDRIVKNTYKALATNCICPPKLPICICNHKASLNLINRKPTEASEKEMLENSRSKSAKLRIAEKI